MRITLLFFGYLLLCLLLAAFCTVPVIYYNWLPAELHPARFMSRLAQLFMLLGGIPLLRYYQLHQRPQLGYDCSRRTLFISIAGGWGAGVLFMTTVVLLLILLDIRLPVIPTANWLQRSAQALIGGFLIAIIEETCFRGALFSAIQRRGHLITAIIAPAVLYALVHFIKPAAIALTDMSAGDAVVTMLLLGFSHAIDSNHIDSAVALFLAGVLLTLVRVRSGHIGWCIGIHAGWVWVIQTTRRLTDGTPAAPYGYLVGNYDGVIGWLAAALLAMTIIVWWRLQRY